MCPYNLEKIIHKSIEYCESSNYASFDVYDALNSPLINHLLKKKQLLRRVAIQVICRIPFNIRPILGIKKMVHTKALSDLLSIYTTLYKKTDNQSWKIKAKTIFDILMARKIVAGAGYGWGLNFPYSTRFVDANSDTPNLYNTLNAAQAILDYFEIESTIDVHQILENILLFMFEYLGTVKETHEITWIRYYPEQKGMPALNVNAISAALFVRINNLFGEDKIDSGLIAGILTFLKHYQNPDGSWYYTTTDQGKWIDGFHTGFILESIAYIWSRNKNPEVRKMLERGVRFYKDQMFTKNHIPKYYNTRVYPIESQNCAQAIQTIARLKLIAGFPLNSMLKEVIDGVIRNLWDNKGYFYYKRGPFIINKQYYIRWSQTPMILALLYANESLNSEL